MGKIEISAGHRNNFTRGLKGGRQKCSDNMLLVQRDKAAGRDSSLPRFAPDGEKEQNP